MFFPFSAFLSVNRDLHRLYSNSHVYWILTHTCSDDTVLRTRLVAYCVYWMGLIHQHKQILHIAKSTPKRKRNKKKMEIFKMKTNISKALLISWKYPFAVPSPSTAQTLWVNTRACAQCSFGQLIAPSSSAFCAVIVFSICWVSVPPLPVLKYF